MNEKTDVEAIQAVSVKSGNVLIIRGVHLRDFPYMVETMKERFASQGIIDLTFIGVPAGERADVFELLDEEQMRQKGWIRIKEAEARG